MTPGIDLGRMLTLGAAVVRAAGPAHPSLFYQTAIECYAAATALYPASVVVHAYRLRRRIRRLMRQLDTDPTKLKEK